jgi:hypothetical protein
MATVTKIGANVITYKAISELYAAHKKGQQDQIDAMKTTARDLFDAYVRSLQLVPDTWVNAAGHHEPYVQMGKFDGHSHIAKRIQVICEDGADPKIQFSFSMALQASPDLLPDTFVNVDMEMSKGAHEFRLTMLESGRAIGIPFEGGEGRFGAACSVITQCIMSAFTVKKARG